MWAIEIDGVDHRTDIFRAQGKQPQITRPFNERATARFSCKPGYLPDLLAEVIIYDQDGTTALFGGLVHDREIRGWYDSMLVDVECVDWSWYFDRITIDSGTLGTATLTLLQVLQWFDTNYLSARGFTLDPSQATGPSIPVSGFSWQRMYVSDAFRDYVTPASGGWVFRVQPDKTWGFYDPSTLTSTAPISITDTVAPVREPQRLGWRDSAGEYATKIILVCGGTATREKTDTFEVDAQIISDGYYDTEVRATSLNAPAATINGSPATIGGTGNQLIWAYAGGANGVARVTAGTYTPTLGDDITITYTAQYPFEYVEDSLDGDVIEMTVTRDDIIDRATAAPVAEGLLSRHYQQPKTIEIPTMESGLEPGQVIALERADRGLTSQNALITAVTVTLTDDENWEYSATALTGVYQGSPLDFWRGGFGSGSGGGTTVVTFTGGTNPVIGQPLTKTDDTNVTLTLGGGHATALVAPASLTLGWTGSLAVSRGGTGLSSLTANRIPYGNGTSALQSSANLTFNGATLAITGAGTFSTSVTTPLLGAIGALSIFPTGAASIQTGSGNLTLSPAGDVVLGPVGNDILPSIGYTKNLGALTNKYLTLHAAELWVETLVAQDTMATIGGRVLVGPTTSLTADLTAVATSISVKHNQMVSGDRVFMQANGFYEAMAITSGPSGSGPYTYSVTRNLDGSGANAWTAGDAVFNTGTTGDGFIDLYSINGLIPGSTAGPTIVGNVRTGTTYSDIAARWAIGNLNGLYGYGTDTYGAAFGDNSNAWVKIDATNGVRIGHNATTYVEVDASGNALFSGRVTIGTGSNLLPNSEFRRESDTLFGSSTGTTGGTDGPKTGRSLGANTIYGDGSFWRLGLYTGTGSPTWSWQHVSAVGTLPPGLSAIFVHRADNTPSASSSKDIEGPGFAAAATERVEFSFYAIKGDLAQIDALLAFFDSSDSLISTSTGTAITSSGSDATDWADYARTYVIATAPANTAYAVPIMRLTYPASPGASPVFETALTRLYFGYAQPGQTQPTPWAPGGVTLIDGSMLATDMVLTNTLRGGSATDLTTGTGFILDATSTPTFRVGDPSGNRIKYDGSDIEIVSGNLVVDDSSVRITALADNGSAFTQSTGYTFDVASGTLGMAGNDGGTNGRQLALWSSWNGAANRLAGVSMSTSSMNSGGGAKSASVVCSATANTSSLVQISGETLVFNQVPVSGSAGAVSQYMTVRVGVTTYKIPLHSV